MMNKFTNSGNGGHDFTQFELIQNGSLTGGIETDHKNTHFPLAKEFGE